MALKETVDIVGNSCRKTVVGGVMGAGNRICCGHSRRCGGSLGDVELWYGGVGCGHHQHLGGRRRNRS